MAKKPIWREDRAVDYWEMSRTRREELDDREKVLG
jgi:hypothetical protein